MPGMDWVWAAVNLVASFALVTLLFALIYKLLPDAEIGWRDVWVGAVSTAVLDTKAAVERKVVTLILSAPPRKLPRAFIDSTTGLVRNNVQVVCTKKKQPQRSFLCAVRLPSDSAGKALYVRYRTDKNGRGAFKWYGYGRS